MPKSIPSDLLTPAGALQRVSSLFAMPFYELDGALLSGDPSQGQRLAQESSLDLIGLEALVNHYHLSDFVDQFELDPKTRRKQLKRLGEAVLSVWSERLQRLIGNRTALFYLGGREEVILRFHLERSGSAPWAPLDPDFLRKERLSVFRLTRNGLTQVGPAS